MKQSICKLKVLLFALAMVLFVTSCLEEKPLENNRPVGPESLLNMQRAFIAATNGITPLALGKNEWALYRISARLYTGPFQGLGYQSVQVMATTNSAITVEGANYNTRNDKIVITDYKEPTTPEEIENPVIDLQKEWDCNFVKPPYYLWYGDCPLPPEQNLWVFGGISEPTVPIFYDLTVRNAKQKLPQKLIDDGRCYNLPNCEINVTYLEYDMIGKVGGQDKRIHYVSSFTGDLPYLASNIKNCYSTLLEVNGDNHPGEVCQELLDFIPGETPPSYCPDNNSGPCVESKFAP